MISNEYVAGFFDGEGSVYAATRNQSNPRARRPSPTIIVAISNTVEAPLLLCKERWGGSIHKTLPKARCRAQYQWIIASRDASRFLRDIHPHTIIKRDVVSAAIEFCDLMALPARERNDYSNTVERHGRKWVSPSVRPEFREKIDAIHARIRALNVRGAPFNETRRYTNASAH